MTRIRGGLAALAVGLLLAGCGPVESAPEAGGASSAGTAAATSQADGSTATSQDTSGGGGRWCEAVKAFTASIEPLFAMDAVEADVDQARARLKELQAAAPAEISTQVAAYGEFATAVIDTRGKNMVEDPAAYARLGSTIKKLETAMPPVSDYTVKHCPGLDKPLPVEAS
jgi:ABC-type glycerol-3-phosphate transport system substrate-binding protein